MVSIQKTHGASPAAMMAGEMEAKTTPRPLSVFDMFTIGIGPSSSHTVGPMLAAAAFARNLQKKRIHPTRLRVDLFGSLGATGRGHSTDRAVMMGLEGYEPATVPAEVVAGIDERVAKQERLRVNGQDVPFTRESIVFRPLTTLPYHANALTLTAEYEGGSVVKTYYSIGGGFVMVDESDDPTHPDVAALVTDDAKLTHEIAAPYPFATARELLDRCEQAGLSIAQLVRANEEVAHSHAELDNYLDAVEAAMAQCIEAGCTTQGVLPGGLNVARRASKLFANLQDRTSDQPAACDARAWVGTNADPLRAMDWVNLYALAVNEENAAGHRVVTAPTNGAAGVIPAVLGYLLHFCPEGQADPVRGRRDFLLAATAIGGLIKTNASIAGAEVGCQGEVGSASAMAAAGLAQALGGTPMQVENAAEIAMEHSLGMTCDPVGGLVQIPCIERNAIAAVKAINAARMALWGDGRHTVPLDAAIETMWQTGQDMHSRYKETSVGGLAVNVVEC
ncbi:L-serine ammonia-lyase [Gleimia hominis]|uniref:L-serine ammonia-lyase n=1 Tax=Gleimia hominis TaxID=595468 RepID=UPI000C80D759|nr:L-serine ammonia-lyase [Gleimia hominis]WIK64216.1 L-serine ammonia-lyase [Gleimia hominis]